jgi:tryptophanyl-tRNA synthetase
MFEPDERNLKILYEREVNKLGNLFPLVVSDTEGECDLHISSGKIPVDTGNKFYNENVWSASSSIRKPKEHLDLFPWCEFNEVQKVEKISLDFFCRMEEINHVDFIWMDVQGCEDLVFKGASNILIKTQYIYTEYSNEEMYEGQKSLDDIMGLLPGEWRIRQDYGGDVLFENLTYKDNLLKSTGAWTIKDANEHAFDSNLALAISKFLKKNKLKSCVDFGCGPGEYVKFLRSKKLKCDGYDGNIYTEEITNGKCKILDLTSDFELLEKFDCVISLEVGEHIPNELENKFISNICKHAKEYIILSWGIPGQGGYGHINCRDNNYIKERIKSKGFDSCNDIEKKLREESTLTWFKNTIMVFKNNK